MTNLNGNPLKERHNNSSLCVALRAMNKHNMTMWLKYALPLVALILMTACSLPGQKTPPSVNQAEPHSEKHVDSDLKHHRTSHPFEKPSESARELRFQPLAFTFEGKTFYQTQQTVTATELGDVVGEVDQNQTTHSTARSALGSKKVYTIHNKDPDQFLAMRGYHNGIRPADTEQGQTGYFVFSVDESIPLAR
ncbi:hypothetical protein [Thalassobacillus sp. CUG 92003]|uniref:hypothetical protein n=1 Tax=Thalassobacillus sp. CUG 92003 TaxID=2736641 RepID=UPI0015E75616|nr:hypothetical protein [Thalassobacillus sp. CUG 92003]